jgi:hypothetical protein
MSPLSGVLGEAWTLYRRHAAHFLLLSFVIYLVVAVVAAILTWFAGTVGYVFGSILNLFGMFLLQAALVKAVQDVRDGRVDLGLKGTVSAALPYVAPVALASVLASIGIAVGLALFIVPGLILLTFWSLIVPWIVIAGVGPLVSFSRSWRTVSGYAWNVFATFVLTFIIMFVFEVVLSLILLPAPFAVRSFISDVVAGTLVAPFIALVVTLVYYRLTTAHETGPYGETPYGGGYEPGAYGAPEPPPSAERPPAFPPGAAPEYPAPPRPEPGPGSGPGPGPGPDSEPPRMK